MLSLNRIGAASLAIFGLIISPAEAQYKTFSYDGIVYTDVVVNGRALPLETVQEFEETCNIRAASGRWWLNDKGHLGLAGRSAIYDVNSCRAITRSSAKPNPTGGNCTFFSSGWICPNGSSGLSATFR